MSISPALVVAQRPRALVGLLEDSDPGPADAPIPKPTRQRAPAAAPPHAASPPAGGGPAAAAMCRLEAISECITIAGKRISEFARPLFLYRSKAVGGGGKHQLVILTLDYANATFKFVLIFSTISLPEAISLPKASTDCRCAQRARCRRRGLLLWQETGIVRRLISQTDVQA
jgi:hypothetical protein